MQNRNKETKRLQSGSKYRHTEFAQQYDRVTVVPYNHWFTTSGVHGKKDRNVRPDFNILIKKITKYHHLENKAGEDFSSQQDLEQNVSMCWSAGQTWTLNHISPVLRSWHGLPVCQSIDFEIQLYEALDGLGPKRVVLLVYEPSRAPGTRLLLKTQFSFYSSHIWTKK